MHHVCDMYPAMRRLDFQCRWRFSIMEDVDFSSTEWVRLHFKFNHTTIQCFRRRQDDTNKESKWTIIISYHVPSMLEIKRDKLKERVYQFFIRKASKPHMREVNNVRHSSLWLHSHWNGWILLCKPSVVPINFAVPFDGQHLSQCVWYDPIFALKFGSAGGSLQYILFYSISNESAVRVWASHYTQKRIIYWYSRAFCTHVCATHWKR